MNLHKKLKPVMERLRTELVDAEFRRIGSQGDGGYVVLDKSYKGSFLISGGISNDNNFEFALADLGASAIQVDFSILHPPRKHHNMTFIPNRIVGEGHKVLGYDITLDEIVNTEIDSSKSTYSDLILKLDVEGSEWEILETSVSLPRFEQVLLELHYLERLASPNLIESSIAALDRLLESFVPVFISGNNCCGFVTIGGYSLPRVMEISLVNRNSVKILGSGRNKLNADYQSQNYPERAPLVLKNW